MVEIGINFLYNDGRRRKGGYSPIIWLGKYRIETMLGGAGSGEVFLAEHVKLQARRVIKRIRKGHPFYRQLAGEAEILKRLKHPGVPYLHDVEEDDQYLYLIEEFIEGTSLENMVLSDRLKEHQIVHISLQICIIIQYLHQQNPPIYYLDLKPEHVMLSEGTVRLIDFGSAVQPEKTEESCVPELYLGTGGYAPPELYQDKTAGAYSDIYEIGSLLYFLLTGTVFSASTKTWENGRYPCTRKLWRLVKNCLQPDPKHRPGMERLLGVLEELEQTNGFRGPKWLKWSDKEKKKTNAVSFGKRVIGLIGTHPGAGVTHISLLLTFYLAEATGKSVAYLEYNRHGDCSRFLARLSGNAHTSCKKELTEKLCHTGWKGKADLFPAITAEGLTELLNEEYAYYVIDFGCELEECLAEYLRCEDKIVVAQLTEWKLDELERFQIREKETHRQSRCHYFYNLATEAQGKRAERAGDCFPWEGDVCRPSDRARRLFAEALARAKKGSHF